MPALKTFSRLFALVTLVVFLVPDRVHAQAGKAAARPGAAGSNQIRSGALGFGALPLGLSTRQKSYAAEAEPLDLDAGPPITPPHPYYYGYAPWWAAPRSVKYKRYYYPHPGDNEPRLGLRAWDPYSWEMGLQLPVDSEPLPTYVPGQVYEGMVARALRSRAESDRLKGRDPAIELMKAGEYRKAGRVLAEGFRRDDSPRYPLLLAEVFFGLGKFPHAQLLLEEALRNPDVASYLPRNVADHFSGADEFEEKLNALVEADDGPSLLRAYFQLHSKAPEKGLEILRQMVENADPLSELAGILYRHYLGQVFQPQPAAEEEEEPAAEE